METTSKAGGVAGCSGLEVPWAENGSTAISSGRAVPGDQEGYFDALKQATGCGTRKGGQWFRLAMSKCNTLSVAETLHFRRTLQHNRRA